MSIWARLKFPVFIIGVCFLCGCESVQLPDSSIKPIVLKQSYQRVSRGLATIQFPAGVYEPDFTTQDGVYYRAPSHLVDSALGIHTLMRGGLYIPNSSDFDMRQGAWFDQQEGSGGALTFGLSSPKNTYRFENPIPYEIQNQ
jgi:hypothetical protein